MNGLSMRHILLHGHLFKNAGTSLDWSLRRSLGQGFCEHREDAAMRAEPAEQMTAALSDPDLQALSSHNLPVPPPAISGVRFHTLFLLRDPVARALSIYAFERSQQVETPGALAAKRLDLPAYMAWRLHESERPALRNFQLRYLAGGELRHAPGAVDASAVAAARERVISGAIVGLVERYDESMVVFEQALRPYFPGLDLACVPQNVGRGVGFDEGRLDEHYEAMLGAVYPEFLAYNSEDLALYAVAEERLEGRIAAIPDFPEHLADFRRRSAALRTSSVPGAR
jgi:hypothetical protein